jgi:hypothetical protein
MLGINGLIAYVWLFLIEIADCLWQCAAVEEAESTLTFIIDNKKKTPF